MQREIAPGNLEFSVETINQIDQRESQLPETNTASIWQHVPVPQQIENKIDEQRETQLPEPNPASIWQHVQVPQQIENKNDEQRDSWSNRNQNWSDLPSPISHALPLILNQTHTNNQKSQTQISPKPESNIKSSVQKKVEADCEKKFKKIKFEIESQNLLIERLKMLLVEKMLINPRTSKEESNISSIKNCIDKEIKNLHKMIKIGFEEQEKCKYSNDWGNIPLTIALDPSTQAQVLLVGMKNMELVIPETPSNISNVSGCAGKLHLHDLQQKLNFDNKKLEEERYKLQETLIMKDTQMDCLQKKVHVMNCQLAKVCQENKKLVSKMKDIEQNKDSKRFKKSPCSSLYEADVRKLDTLKV